ncbi:MAG: hypothetical protein NTW16_02240 [Bacteroidetes bacterium]|nr:hypothetical protein [Bacteroidota bacterium]
MLLILTASISNRLRYIASLMLREMLGIEFGIITSREEFSSYEGPKISYAKEPEPGGLFIESSELLFESNLITQEVFSSTFNGEHVLFQTANPLSSLPFDPFAAAFYLVTRYEEYNSHKKDSFGRYPATESIAWKGNFLEIPVIHRWVEILERLLKKQYPGIKFHYPSYQFVPTIDVDHAWCYRGRTAARTVGGFGRSLMHGHLKEMTEGTCRVSARPV